MDSVGPASGYLLFTVDRSLLGLYTPKSKQGICVGWVRGERKSWISNPPWSGQTPPGVGESANPPWSGNSCTPRTPTPHNEIERLLLDMSLPTELGAQRALGQPPPLEWTFNPPWSGPPKHLSDFYQPPPPQNPPWSGNRPKRSGGTW